MEYRTILIKRKIIIIGFIGFDLPTAGRDPCNPCNPCNPMITFLGDNFLYMLKLMTLPSHHSSLISLLNFFNLLHFLNPQPSQSPTNHPQSCE